MASSPWLSSLAGAQNSSEIQNPIRQNANGTWTVPESFEAGNRWSNANINKDWATQFGGTYTAAKPTYSAISNPFSANYASGQGKALNAGSDIGSWTFNQDPTQYISSGQGATFVPGQGQSKLGSAVKSIAPIAGIAAAPFLAAGIAGMAGGGTFGSGIAGMSGMSGATGAGATAAGGYTGLGMAGSGAGAGTAAAGAGGTATGGGLLGGAISGGGGMVPAGGATLGSGFSAGAAGGTGMGATGLGTAAATGAGASGFSLANPSTWGQGISSLMPSGSASALDVAKLGLGGLSTYLNYNQNKDLAESMRQPQDVFGPYRGQYQQQLSNLWGNPSQYMQDPGIQASFNSGLEAVRRGTPGAALDGKMNNQLMEYGMQFVPQMQQNYSNALAPLAGASLYTPGNTNAQYQATQQQQSALNQLFNGIGNVAQKWWGDSPVQQGNTQYTQL